MEEVDLKGEGCVDAEWLAYLGAFRYLRRLCLADCKGVTDSAIWPLSGMTCLKELDLSRCSKFTDAGIGHLLSTSNLEKLYISETGVTTKGVALLNSLGNLQVLDMGGIPVADKEFCSLQCLTELEYLDIWGSEISNVGALVLKMFPRLGFLNAAWTNITKLPFLPSLKFLNMSNCDIRTIFYDGCGVKVPLSKLLVRGANFVDVENAFSNLELSCITYLDMSAPISNFRILDKMKGLEHLDISFSQMTDNFMRCVASVGGNLRYLNLSNTKVTSQGISELVGNVANLETLLLSHTPINDEALSYISLMPSLKVVDVSQTRIKGISNSGGNTSEKAFSLNMLRYLRYLESLNLEETPLSDEAVHPLASLTQLKSLYLKSDFLSEVSLHALSSLTELKHLGFRGAVLTNSGLLLYKPPPLLCLLDLRGCWLLGSESVSSFSMKHLAIQVKHEYLPVSDPKSGACSSSQEITRASPLGHKGLGSKKAAKFPDRTKDVSFVDERLKYSREELLELQLSQLPNLSLHDIPELLRKE